MGFTLVYIISTICSLIFFYLLSFCVKKQERRFSKFYDTDKRSKRTIGGLIGWFILSTFPVVNSIILILSVTYYCVNLGSEERWIIDHPIFDKIAKFLSKEV